MCLCVWVCTCAIPGDVGGGGVLLRSSDIKTQLLSVISDMRKAVFSDTHTHTHSLRWGEVKRRRGREEGGSIRGPASRQVVTHGNSAVSRVSSNLLTTLLAEHGAAVVKVTPLVPQGTAQYWQRLPCLLCHFALQLTGVSSFGVRNKTRQGSWNGRIDERMTLKVAISKLPVHYSFALTLNVSFTILVKVNAVRKWGTYLSNVTWFKQETSEELFGS